jgi:hypothetical protein
MFIKSWQFMLVLVLTLAVIAVVLVVVGVMTHSEPGYMRTVPGFTRADVPVQVCAGAYSPDEAGTRVARSAVTDAVRTVNGRMGFELLTMNHRDGEGCTHGILVTVGVPYEHSHGHTIVEPGGSANFVSRSRFCEITTTNTGTDELLGLAIQHELGHCLGLAHDPFPSSIMCGSDPGQPSCTLSPPPAGSLPPWIDDHDRALLLVSYRPRR